MYCPSCGTALFPENNYCNRCGIDLGIIKGSGNSKLLEKSVESTVWSIVRITISLLGIMIAVLALMKGFGLSVEVVVFFMALMFVILLAIDGLLVWQLSRLNSLAKEARSAAQLERGKTTEPDAIQKQMLVEPAMSIIEKTTQILEPAYGKRTKK